MASSAVEIAKLINYVGAGTVEFIVDVSTGKYYFLEVNTRLQVEHPVTEAVTGLDLVAMQIWVAQGGSIKDFLSKHGGLTMKGHAIEVRIYAEDPANEFFPVIGTIGNWKVPSIDGVRSDSGIVQNSEITSYYDPLISKLTVYGSTRGEAIQKLLHTLRSTILFGLPANNISFLFNTISSNEFISGIYDTNIVSRLVKKVSETKPESVHVINGVICATVWEWNQRRTLRMQRPYRRIKSGFRNVPDKRQNAQYIFNEKIKFDVFYEVLKEGDKETEFDLIIDAGKNETASWKGVISLLSATNERSNNDKFENGHVRISIDGILTTPMPCRIISVNVQSGAEVKIGDSILTIESMKMETKIRATADGIVNIKVKEGEMIKAGEIVAIIS
ncbi:hypothetical protein HK100_011519 [Physocladia obscura]|uniref:Uncharacterized protein n=1 Tax=Physocladia obscura TaxID=109957 RepID=A0AAD5T2K5_9FUNG|nr:hypothetical protein HK100_011519 [Physocladia obscura]